MPAEKRDAHQFPLQDQHRIIEIGQESIGIPGGLVLRGADIGTFGDILQSVDNIVGAGNVPLQPEIDPRPQLRHDPGLLAGQQESKRAM
jgi:hypothetical protein